MVSILHTSSYNLVISDYDRAFEMNPRLAMAYNNRGFAYVKASIRSDMFKPGGKIIVDFCSVEEFMSHFDRSDAQHRKMEKFIKKQISRLALWPAFLCACKRQMVIKC